MATLEDYAHLTSIPPTDLLADAAYGQLSEAILRNQLQPGTQLSVPELSRRLGISRSPVREAVQRLVHDGLADYRGRRGTFVSALQLSDFMALLEVREVLEGLAARLAAQRATEDEVAELQAVHADLARLLDEEGVSTAAFVQLDMALHQSIRDIARNGELSPLLARAQARAHLSMYSLWQGSRNAAAAHAEHAAICAAIAAGDPDAADRAARAHIAGLRDRVSAEAAAQ